MAERYAVRPGRGEYILIDAERNAAATVAPEHGNNVTHFRVTPRGRDVPVDIFLPPSDAGGLGPNGYSAGNPILFPFPNRVRAGRYSFQGRSYELDLNEPTRGNHIHGLVAKLPWQVEASGTSGDAGAWLRAVLSLDQYPDAMRQYPFPCRLKVTTALLDGALVQEIVVENSGSTALPMGYGTHPWHPAALDGAARELTEVRVPGRGYWELHNLVPTGQVLSVEQDTAKFDLREWQALDGHEYDDVFTDLVRRPDGWSEAGIRFPNAGYEILVEASPEFREWVLFAPASRPVVCLEPYTGATNAVNLQSQGIDAGLVVVEPAQRWTGMLRTSLRA